jgi:hypothetical protein
LKKETKSNFKHGKRGTKEYNAWQAMKQRCTGRAKRNYHRYGGRGIKVCKRWFNSFENFYKDMGPKPSPKHSLDRINNNGNYTPKNCRWASFTEQAFNRRNNVSIDAVAIAKELGLSASHIYDLHKTGKLKKRLKEVGKK